MSIRRPLSINGVRVVGREEGSTGDSGCVEGEVLFLSLLLVYSCPSFFFSGIGGRPLSFPFSKEFSFSIRADSTCNNLKKSFIEGSTACDCSSEVVILVLLVLLLLLLLLLL